MTRFIEDTKLDFDDVLLIPQRSSISSRSQVSLTRTFKFSNNEKFDCVPVIAANMSSVATFEMATALGKHKMLTALHKHYSIKQIEDFIANKTKDEDDNTLDYTFFTFGITEADTEKLDHLLTKQINPSSLPFRICLDVANGYMEKFVDHCARIKDKYPDIILMAGNVVTGEITQQLILSGVDIVKVGIGGGCFVAGTMIETETGKIPIESVEIGTLVLTHTNSWRRVTNTFINTNHNQVFKINNEICASPNHEFYVLHKRFKDVVTDENIHSFAEWISAEKLNKDFLLLKTSK